MVVPKAVLVIFWGTKLTVEKAVRQELRRCGITPVIPQRRNEKRRCRFNRGLYRERNPC